MLLDDNSQGLSQVQVTDGTQESDGERDDITGSQSEHRTRQVIVFVIMVKNLCVF